MKIKNLLNESETEKTTPDHAPPASDTVGHYLTVAQVANLCNVSMSRIRQFIMEGRIKVKSPEPGRRDNLIDKAEAEKFCDENRERTGRKPKSVENNTHGDEKPKKKD